MWKDLPENEKEELKKKKTELVKDVKKRREK